MRWYQFNRPDKKRPVLVLTRDAILEYLGEVTVAPITTTVRDIPSEVLLSKAAGMPRDCAVNCEHLHTVARAKIGRLIVTLSPAKMLKVGCAIRFAIDI